MKKIYMVFILGIIGICILTGCSFSTHKDSALKEFDVDYTTNDNGTYTYKENIYKYIIEAGASSYFMIYVEMGNKELAMDAMEQMMSGYDTIREPKNSELYQHMKFNEDDGLEKMKILLLKSFDSDPRLDFLREEPRYQQLCSKLE